MDHTPAITPAGHPLDDEGELTKLHPGYAHALRLRTTLTAIPFWMVMDGSASHAMVLGTVVVMAVVQIFVHLIYFLHMNTSSEERWNLVALVFTVLIIAIVVVGSLWIMYNLNINMMVH